ASGVLGEYRTEILGRLMRATVDRGHAVGTDPGAHRRTRTPSWLRRARTRGDVGQRERASPGERMRTAPGHRRSEKVRFYRPGRSQRGDVAVADDMARGHAFRGWS